MVSNNLDVKWCGYLKSGIFFPLKFIRSAIYKDVLWITAGIILGIGISWINMSEVKTTGQSNKTFYNLKQIYKLVLKLDNMLWLRKYLVRILGHYTLKYSQSYFFDHDTISNLGTLFYARGLNCYIGLSPPLLFERRESYVTKLVTVW